MGTTALGRAAGLRRERTLASPQHVGESFINTYAPTVVAEGSKWSSAAVVASVAMQPRRRRPMRPLPAWDPRADWARMPRSGLRATWLGHSTVLLEMDGLRILTDPVWARRASPLPFFGPKRFQPVPIALNQLPDLDVVLISHDHYDHLDPRAIAALASRGTRFVTSLALGKRLESWGVEPSRITELDWWESIDIKGVTITAAPAHHFSGRAFNDRNATLWSSFALRTERHAVYFSGDSGLSDAFKDIGARLGPFDLVMLEVGAFHPSWATMHLGTANALKAWADLGSGRLLPIHWGTFDLAAHVWDAPVEELFLSAPKHRLFIPVLGQASEPAHTSEPVAWWRGAWA